MRIILVNWARIWDGASHGGGVNQYCQALALELLRRGHEVVSVFSGTTYVRRPRGCFIRRNPDWMPGLAGSATDGSGGGAGGGGGGASAGVKIFEVVNSPVIAPSIVQFSRPLGEVSAPELEARIGRLFEWLRPDAIHWNNIEGFSIGCVKHGQAVAKHTVFSLHNYHTICPQVYLMQHHRETCYDFDNGHNCTTCIKAEDPDAVRRAHETAFELGRGGPEVGEALKEFRSAVSWLPKSLTSGASLARTWLRTRGRLPGVPVESPDDTARALPPPAADTRGKTPHLMAELNPPPPPDLTKPEFRPLDNTILPEPPSAKPPNDYAARRAAMVEMLSSCDRVLAVSTFVRRKFESMGVDRAKIRTLPIGSRINRVIALKPDLVFDPPRFEPPPTHWSKTRPINLHFMGYNHYYKGLPVFAEALERMAPQHLRQINLSIFALDGQGIEWMFRRLEPRLASLEYACGYNYHDIPWMLGGKDLTVVPSVWWDNAPQTVFESMACGVPVLGAAVGGIPDFITDGHDGLLFRGNDRAHLADRLAEIVENPWLLQRLRANVRPPKSIEAHAEEMELVYTGRDAALYPPDPAAASHPTVPLTVALHPCG